MSIDLPRATQVLNVLTYALYDLAHLAAEELTNTISKAQASHFNFCGRESLLVGGFIGGNGVHVSCGANISNN